MVIVGSSIVLEKIVRLDQTTLYIWGYLSGNFARFVTLQAAERTTRSKVNRIIEFFGRDLKNWNWLSRDIAVLVGPRPYAPLMAFATCHWHGLHRTTRMEICVNTFCNNKKCVCARARVMVKANIYLNILYNLENYGELSKCFFLFRGYSDLKFFFITIWK